MCFVPSSEAALGGSPVAHSGHWAAWVLRQHLPRSLVHRVLQQAWPGMHLGPNGMKRQVSIRGLRSEEVLQKLLPVAGLNVVRLRLSECWEELAPLPAGDWVAVVAAIKGCAFLKVQRLGA